MARKKHHRPATASTLPPLASELADYGSGFTRTGGRWRPRGDLAAADGIELTEVADITRPEVRDASVRVARRVDPLLAILDVRGSDLDRARFLAAERFRAATAMAEGRPIRVTNFEFLAHGSFSDGPQLSRLGWQTRVRRAWLAIRGSGNDADVADVVRMIVLGSATIEMVDRRYSWKCHGRRARRLLDTGLDRLVDFYHLGNRGCAAE